MGPVKIIKNVIPGCFFKRGKSLKALEKQKGVNIIKAITHLKNPNDNGETKLSTDANLPTIEFPDQKRDAKHNTIAALSELLTNNFRVFQLQ